MKSISIKVWSHNSLQTDKKEFVHQLRLSEPRQIPNYRQLVYMVAQIAYHNRQYSLFFRGQDKEFMDEKNRSTIFPSIYRMGAENKVSDTIANRLELLEKKTFYLRSNRSSIGGDDTFTQYDPIKWAILQHYEVCQTPLLDLTNSLRVACSFALRDASDYGIVYVLGLPHVNGSISFYVEEELMILKLLAICPPKALRPHFQDGYLSGTFPVEGVSILDTKDDIEKHDFARRLIAKFRIPKERFWDRDFTEIPKEALFPENDEMVRICDRIKSYKD